MQPIDTDMDAQALLAIWRAEPPRAAHFIVTVYGDIVVPRGGSLWMGTLIEIAEAAALNESLVRTAMSRLVSAGQLVGERSGRRSYYRLTDRAQVDFAAAARLLFDPPADPERWVFIANTDTRTDVPHGFVPVSADLLMGPDRPGQVPSEGIVFRADVVRGAASLSGFVARYWDLERHAAAYLRVTERFAPLADALARGATLPGPETLLARLRLVDDFRAAVLHDPGLPAAALPSDWPGTAARALFAQLYRALSPRADSHVGATSRDIDGLLPAVTPQVTTRLRGLARRG